MNAPNTKKQSATERIAQPSLGSRLDSMGIAATRDGDAYYVDLGYGQKLIIKYKYGRLSMILALRANPDDLVNQLFAASKTMANTTMTKVFLRPEGGDFNICFCAENICQIHDDLKRIIDCLLKMLTNTVRIFLKNSVSIVETLKARSVAALLLSQAEHQRPS